MPHATENAHLDEAIWYMAVKWHWKSLFGTMQLGSKMMQVLFVVPTWQSQYVVLLHPGPLQF